MAITPRRAGFREMFQKSDTYQNKMALVDHNMNSISTIRTILKQIVPPVLPYLARKVVANGNQDNLFRGQASFFKQRLLSSRCYGEYGCGTSTVWVSENTSIPIYAVDTSRDWIDKVYQQTAVCENMDLQHVDLGPLGEWGRPLSYVNRGSIMNYVAGIWNRPQKPDTILVDGRFRVACFLKSLLEAELGACIIFDDYVGRVHFHLVEEFLEPDQFCGDQAIFVVPEVLDRKLIEKELERFIYVMD